MKLTRWQDLVISGVLAGVVVSLLLQLDFAAVPPLPLLAGVTCALLALIEFVFSFSVRARIAHRKDTRPLPAQTAVRSLALAKASSVLGALMAGCWLAVIVYVLPRREHLVLAGQDFRSSVVGLVSAAALIAAGLWLEHCLRAPEDPERPDDAGRSRRSE